MDCNRIIATVLKIRSAKSALTKEYESKKAELDRQQEMLENALLGHLTQSKAKNMRYEAGTAYTEEVVKVSCDDWPAYHNWLIAQKDLGGLQKRVGEKFITDWIEANKDQELPPGIKIHRQKVARVRTGNDD